jgi:hypothetical protein
MNPLRLATAQIVVRDDPRDSGQLRQSGHDVRDLMRQARRAGARIIHFPEGATCSPHKRIMSVTGPEVWAEYERLDVDGALCATGPGQTPVAAPGPGWDLRRSPGHRQPQ